MPIVEIDFRSQLESSSTKDTITWVEKLDLKEIWAGITSRVIFTGDGRLIGDWKGKSDGAADEWPSGWGNPLLVWEVHSPYLTDFNKVVCDPRVYLFVPMFSISTHQFLSINQHNRRSPIWIRGYFLNSNWFPSETATISSEKQILSSGPPFTRMMQSEILREEIFGCSSWPWMKLMAWNSAHIHQKKAAMRISEDFLLASIR